MQLHLLGKELFTGNGYYDIGMDHFALPEDDLYKAMKQKKLHRNFMGYTTQAGGLLIGLGVSSISDAGIAYAQNKKSLHEYYQCINNKQLAVQKGYFLTSEDSDFKQYILDLICTGQTVFEERNLPALQEFTIPELQKLEDDKLVEIFENSVFVTKSGKNFIRNICKAFDLHLLKNKANPSIPVYSQAI